MDDLLQVEFLHYREGIGGVVLHVVAVTDLSRATVPATVMGDDSVAMLYEKQHLSIPIVGRKRPAMMKHDWLILLRTPVLVEELDAVFAGNCAHRNWFFQGAEGSARLSGIEAALGMHVSIVRPAPPSRISRRVALVSRNDGGLAMSPLCLRVRDALPPVHASCLRLAAIFQRKIHRADHAARGNQLTNPWHERRRTGTRGRARSCGAKGDRTGRIGAMFGLRGRPGAQDDDDGALAGWHAACSFSGLGGTTCRASDALENVTTHGRPSLVQRFAPGATTLDEASCGAFAVLFGALSRG